MTTNVKTLSCIGNALIGEAGCPTSPKTFPTKSKAENRAYQAEGSIAWSIFIQPTLVGIYSTTPCWFSSPQAMPRRQRLGAR